MFKGHCKLIYDPVHPDAKRKGFQSSWLKADVSNSIRNYYSWWVAREARMIMNKPLWSSHITVIRGETPKRAEFWKKYEGKIIEFSYSIPICMSDKYCWLKVVAPELEAIRMELGLSRQPRVPFHLTIGNFKNVEPVKEKKVQWTQFPWEITK